MWVWLSQSCGKHAWVYRDVGGSIVAHGGWAWMIVKLLMRIARCPCVRVDNGSSRSVPGGNVRVEM